MKNILVAMAVLLASVSAQADQTFETATTILELSDNGMFPVATATVKYQPACGDSFLRVEQKEIPLDPNVEGPRVIEVSVIVLRNRGIRCVVAPLPQTTTFSVFSMTPFRLVAANIEAPAAPLAVYHQSPGFTPRPQHVFITIDVLGGVWAKVTDYSGDVVLEKMLAQIDAEALAALRAKVNAITDERLMDRDEGEPRCTDAPSTVWEIYRNGSDEAMAIAARSGCHDYFLQSWTNGPLGDQIKATLDAYLEQYYGRE